jgi:hypothetical protein
MAEKAGGRSLVEAKRGEQGHEAEVAQLTGFLQAIHGFVHPEEDIFLPL